jgi:hypothetical protein
VSGQLQVPAALSPGKETPSTHCIEGWVGPKTGLDAKEKRKILDSGYEPKLTLTYLIPRMVNIFLINLLCVLTTINVSVSLGEVALYKSSLLHVTPLDPRLCDPPLSETCLQSADEFTSANERPCVETVRDESPTSEEFEPKATATRLGRVLVLRDINILLDGFGFQWWTHALPEFSSLQ